MVSRWEEKEGRGDLGLCASLNVVEFSTLVGARVGQSGVAATKIVVHVMRLVTSRRAMLGLVREKMSGKMGLSLFGPWLELALLSSATRAELLGRLAS